MGINYGVKLCLVFKYRHSLEVLRLKYLEVLIVLNFNNDFTENLTPTRNYFILSL